MKPGNAGGGKGPQFKVNARRGEGQEIDASLPTLNKVQELQMALHAKAKGSPGFRFYSLYDKIYRKDVLEAAWMRCKTNGGAPGVDGQTFEEIEQYGVDRWLGELAGVLRERKYQPDAVRRVWIPKPNGKKRPLGIPTIRDRVVQTAAMTVMEPIFEADLQPEQYAYRPERSALDAIRRIHALVNTGHTAVVDADLSGYFDSIPHTELMKSVSRRVSDGQMLHLIKMWLTMPVEEKDDRGNRSRRTDAKDTKRGTPQGAPISPLLSNLYMRRFILGWKILGHQDVLEGHIVNYADDFVICCRGSVDVAARIMREMMGKLKLTVNEEKTRICCLPEETFNFLGYTIGRYYPTMGGGRAILGTWPSKKSVEKMCSAISDYTDRKWQWVDAEEMVKGLNRKLTGWANYYSLGVVRRAYAAVEAHTKHRLRQWLCGKHKQRGDGEARYPDRYLHDRLGLISLTKVRQNFLRAKA